MFRTTTRRKQYDYCRYKEIRAQDLPLLRFVLLAALLPRGRFLVERGFQLLHSLAVLLRKLLDRLRQLSSRA